MTDRVPHPAATAGSAAAPGRAADPRPGVDVLVADDERPALDELTSLLRRDPHVRSVHAVASGAEALRWLSEHPVHVAFLDIHMPGLTGLDLARALSRFSVRPAVVFVTADEARATEAFDVEAVDYVLKPVRRERLARAVERAVAVQAAASRAVEGAPSRDTGGTGDAVGHDAAGSGPTTLVPPADETIAVTVGTTTRVVLRSAVRWVQAQGDYSRLVTDTDGYLVREPISDLEERWAAAGFLRVHRSYLVDRAAVTAVRLGGAHPVVVVAGQEVPVSRRMAPAVRDALLGRPGGRP
ncbi:LytTR family DNA-binding domain-containing protein [Oerskovia sp. KBS0722]|uniref:LytR/AlgR family response regulator transcription factor n=1 Tax=Oerskovia sp. KBS0722 TaxID=1179673 RepID=UPI00110D35C0|nr:response regulator transcription factor [Oerskovia sp. KBS0722]QDW63208.1 response regulator transcription factor [Oerskovia sp. KBS0722]